jgi:hypothetical protein
VKAESALQRAKHQFRAVFTAVSNPSQNEVGELKQNQ